MPIYSCTYYNVHDLNSCLGCIEALLNSLLFGAAICGHFVALFQKDRNDCTTAVDSHVSSAVRAVGVLFVLILEFSERNMSRFLNDVHIVEALNEPVDDSGSEGDVSETEYSPSESDSNSSK